MAAASTVMVIATACSTADSIETTTSATTAPDARPSLTRSTDPLLSPLSNAPACGTEEELASWASSTLPGFPTNAASASVLEAGRSVPLMRDVEPACVTAIVGGDYAAWSSRSADGADLVRGVAGPGDGSEIAACYREAGGRPVFSYWQKTIGSGHMVAGCIVRSRVVGSLQGADFGRFQRFVIEFGPAFVDPGPLVEGAWPDPVGDVMYRLMLSGELGTETDVRLGSAVPNQWHTGHAPCSLFYTAWLGDPATESKSPPSMTVMDFCDAQRRVGQFVTSSESLIPENAVVIDLGSTAIARWTAPDGSWSVATTVKTIHGFLSVHAVDPSTPVDVLDEVLAASPLLHLGVLPPLDP